MLQELQYRPLPEAGFLLDLDLLGPLLRDFAAEPDILAMFDDNFFHLIVTDIRADQAES